MGLLLERGTEVGQVGVTDRASKSQNGRWYEYACAKDIRHTRRGHSAENLTVDERGLVSSVSLDQSQSVPWKSYAWGADRWVQLPSFVRSTLGILSGELVRARHPRPLGRVRRLTDRGALSKTNIGHRKYDHTVDNAASGERNAQNLTTINTHMLQGGHISNSGQQIATQLLTLRFRKVNLRRQSRHSEATSSLSHCAWT